MDGKNQPQLQQTDFNDPFSAGQMVGMLVILTFIEDNKGIPERMLQKLKQSSAEGLQTYFDKPTEDILLTIDNIVKETM